MGAIQNILIGLVGSIVGATVAGFLSARQSRLAMVLTMHHEFNVPEMTHSRNLAGETVRTHASQSFDDMRVTIAPEEMQHVWNVMYFYQRLWLAIKYRTISRRFVPDMFGENFYWWYVKSYRDQLVPLDWQAARHIEALMKWIERHADAADRASWLKRANEMRDPEAQ